MPADSETQTVSLPASADLDSVAALRATLAERLAEGASVRLDARDMAEPSTALIQLVEAAAADFAVHGRTCTLLEPSDALCQAYEDLGLYGALMSRLAMAG